MEKSIKIEAGQEIRNEAGAVIGKPGDTVSLRDDQPHGWPLYLVDTSTNSNIQVLE